MKKYPIPWDLVFGLTKHIANGTQESVDSFTERWVDRITPSPVYEQVDLLPPDPGFLLVANHYQRKGLWIMHTAAVMTRAIRSRYGPGDPPVRWVVTANWPSFRLGALHLPNPGDWLLPRVAHALGCYPVAFASQKPAFTAASLRRILRDADRLDRPIGLFPEGVAGSAGKITAPLPGVDRFMRLLARRRFGALPVGVREQDDRLHIRFGELVPAPALAESEDPAALLMRRVADLI